MQQSQPKQIDAIRVRDAQPGDEPAIVSLIHELALIEGDSTPVTEAFVRDYLSSPHSHLLVAEVDEKIAGLLSYSMRPDLYHAAPSAMINELVISELDRGVGIGSALMSELLSRVQAIGCAEVSVTTMVDNEAAQRFYRSFGMVDEALFLEKHFKPNDQTIPS